MDLRQTGTRPYVEHVLHQGALLLCRPFGTFGCPLASHVLQLLEKVRDELEVGRRPKRHAFGRPFVKLVGIRIVLLPLIVCIQTLSFGFRVLFMLSVFVAGHCWRVRARRYSGMKLSWLWQIAMTDICRYGGAVNTIVSHGTATVSRTSLYKQHAQGYGCWYQARHTRLWLSEKSTISVALELSPTIQHLFCHSTLRFCLFQRLQRFTAGGVLGTDSRLILSSVT